MIRLGCFFCVLLFQAWSQDGICVCGMMDVDDDGEDTCHMFSVKVTGAVAGLSSKCNLCWYLMQYWNWKSYSRGARFSFQFCHFPIIVVTDFQHLGGHKTPLMILWKTVKDTSLCRKKTDSQQAFMSETPSHKGYSCVVSITNRRLSFVKPCCICILSILDECSNYVQSFVHYGKRLEWLWTPLWCTSALCGTSTCHLYVHAAFINLSPDEIYIGHNAYCINFGCLALLFQLLCKYQTGNCAFVCYPWLLYKPWWAL